MERAENVLKRLGFESKSNLAESKRLSRSTVTKFFQRQPIQLDSFRRICEALTLNWIEIAEILEEEQLKRLEINNYSSPDTNEGLGQVQVPPIQGSEIDTQKFRRQVIVVDKQSKKIKASLVIEGDISSVNNDLLVALELCLQ